MEDTDWRPSPCPHCGSIRSAQRNPICKNPDCVPISRREHLVRLLRRPFGNLSSGEKTEIADMLEDVPDQIEIYRAIKAAGVRKHGEIARVVAEIYTSPKEPKV